MARADSGVAGFGGAPVKENIAKTAIIPVDNADSWIVGSDRMDRDDADTTKHVRAFFNKVKGAFRAGSIHTDARVNYWDDANVGYYSSALGLGARASGTASHAQGNGTQATGTSSHAEGQTTTASGVASHAEGLSTTASGLNSHAEGELTTASGNQAHAEGRYGTAHGHYSHVEGYSTSAPTNATAAHAEGFSTVASGNYAHAEGQAAVASRSAQHAHASAYFTALGDAQYGRMQGIRQTTDATPAHLTGNGIITSLSSAGTNVLTLRGPRALQLRINAVARRTDVQGEMAGFTWEGVFGRDSTAHGRLIGTPIEAAWGDSPATDAWVMAVSLNIDDVLDDFVQIMVTGEAGKTIRWVANLEWVEVVG